MRHCKVRYSHTDAAKGVKGDWLVTPEHMAVLEWVAKKNRIPLIALPDFGIDHHHDSIGALQEDDPDGPDPEAQMQGAGERESLSMKRERTKRKTHQTDPELQPTPALRSKQEISE